MGGKIINKKLNKNQKLCSILYKENLKILSSITSNAMKCIPLTFFREIYEDFKHQFTIIEINKPRRPIDNNPASDESMQQ